MNSRKHRSFWLRFAQIILGAAVLLWLSVEDTSLLPVFVFAAVAAILAAISITFRFHPGISKTVWWMPVLGTGTGLGAPLLAVGLMILKIGLHSHAAPDYSLEQILNTIQSIPVWVLGGVLVGAGMSLGRHALN